MFCDGLNSKASASELSFHILCQCSKFLWISESFKVPISYLFKRIQRSSVTQRERKGGTRWDLSKHWDYSLSSFALQWNVSVVLIPHSSSAAEAEELWRVMWSQNKVRPLLISSIFSHFVNAIFLLLYFQCFNARPVPCDVHKDI